MTSMGEMSAARMTMPVGEVVAALAEGVGDFRRALTTSFTPRLSDLFTAAIKNVSRWFDYIAKADGKAVRCAIRILKEDRDEICPKR